MGLLVSLIGLRLGCLSYAVFGSRNVPSQPAGQFGQLPCMDAKSLHDLRVGLVYRRKGCFKMNRNIVYTNAAGMSLHFGCFTTPAGHAVCLAPQAVVIIEWL